MSWNKRFFGALGWSMFGPIGGILGYALGSQSESGAKYRSTGRGTNSGDFGASLLILLAAVMKADGKILKSGTTKELTQDAEAKKLYLGTKFSMDI